MNFTCIKWQQRVISGAEREWVKTWYIHPGHLYMEDNSEKTLSVPGSFHGEVHYLSSLCRLTWQQSSANTTNSPYCVVLMFGRRPNTSGWDSNIPRIFFRFSWSCKLFWSLNDTSRRSTCVGIHVQVLHVLQHVFVSMPLAAISTHSSQDICVMVESQAFFTPLTLTMTP